MYYHTDILSIIFSVLLTIFTGVGIFYLRYLFKKIELDKLRSTLLIVVVIILNIASFFSVVYYYIDALPENRILYYGDVRSKKPRYRGDTFYLYDGTKVYNSDLEDEKDVYIVYTKYEHTAVYSGKEPPPDDFVPSKKVDK